MKSIAALSKFTGKYDLWKETMAKADLHWDKEDPASVIQALFKDEAYRSYEWLKDVLPRVPSQYRLSLIFIQLSGLRPSEACTSHKLIRDLTVEGRLSEYWDGELSLLQHYRYPKLFFRRTKNCFITFLSPRMLDLLQHQSSFSYIAIEAALVRYNCRPVRLKGLRKYYATIMKQSLDREMIDLLQGRLDPSVFMKHYYRPLLVDLKQKVLKALCNLENELLEKAG